MPPTLAAQVVVAVRQLQQVLRALLDRALQAVIAQGLTDKVAVVVVLVQSALLPVRAALDFLHPLLARRSLVLAVAAVHFRVRVVLVAEAQVQALAAVLLAQPTQVAVAVALTVVMAAQAALAWSSSNTQTRSPFPTPAAA
jgi:hypothetical protein